MYCRETSNSVKRMTARLDGPADSRGRRASRTRQEAQRDGGKRNPNEDSVRSDGGGRNPDVDGARVETRRKIRRSITSRHKICRRRPPKSLSLIQHVCVARHHSPTERWAMGRRVFIPQNFCGAIRTTPAGGGHPGGIKLFLRKTCKNAIKN